MDAVIVRLETKAMETEHQGQRTEERIETNEQQKLSTK
jgi:hypothetical protein